MQREKVVPIRPPQAPAKPKITYHCSLTSDDPESVLKLAQLSADLGIKMFIMDLVPANTTV